MLSEIAGLRQTLLGTGMQEEVYCLQYTRMGTSRLAESGLSLKLNLLTYCICVVMYLIIFAIQIFDILRLVSNIPFVI